MLNLTAPLAAAVLFSGCTMIMPGKSFTGPLPELTDEQRKLSASLRDDVGALAGDIGERHVGKPGSLDSAVRYIQKRFTAMAYKVRRVSYDAPTFGGDDVEVHNLEAELRGTTTPDQIVVIGAHYDTVPGSPGANDNASGVAALLGIAERFAGKPMPHTVRFVAFVNEEPPFFQSKHMGSLVYARHCRDNKDRVVAMVSFDGLGFFSDEEGSQHYPAPVSLLYPKQADFIGFVTRMSDVFLARLVVRSFREHAKFPSQAIVAPAAITGVGWSDHWSFWQVGYPAIMVTDTLPFRYEHYHQRTDTPDRLNYDRMARVVDGLAKTVNDLATPRPSTDR